MQASEDAASLAMHMHDASLLPTYCRLEYDRGNGPRSPREVTCRDREDRAVVGTGSVSLLSILHMLRALGCCL